MIKNQHHHVRKNLLQIIKLAKPEAEKGDEESKKKMIKAKVALAEYDQLMAKFPEVKKVEMSTEEGYFPDLHDVSVYEIPYIMRDRLRKK